MDKGAGEGGVPTGGSDGAESRCAGLRQSRESVFNLPFISML